MRILLGPVLVLSWCVICPLPAAAQPAPLTLPDAIACARTQSPVLGPARARLEGAQLGERLAGRWRDPQLQVQVENLGHGRDPGDTAIGLDAFALVSQPLEIGGRRAARIGAAGADRALAASTLALLERQVTLDTVERYVGILRGVRTIDVLGRNIDELTALVETFEARVAAGVAPEADLLKFRTEAARQALALARVRLELDRQAAGLAVLLGSTDPVDPRRLVDPVPVAPPDGDARALAIAALDGRPEVRIARARLDLARQSLRGERSLRLPQPALAGGYKRTAYQNTGVLGVSLTLPLFDRNGVSIALATAEERAAARELEAVERRVGLETQTLLANARQLAAHAARAESEVLRPAAQVRSAAQVAFREGAADVLTLVDAERVYTSASHELIDLGLDAFLSAIRARVATGLELLPGVEPLP